VVEIEDERHRASLPWTGEPRSGAVARVVTLPNLGRANSA
jgi:hypothetical protein